MTSSSCERNHRTSQPETVSENKRSFVEIDDDCLVDILGRLSTKDLNSVASTCRRLQAIARTIFETVSTNRDLRITEEMIADYGTDQLDSYLRNFGDLIRSITLMRALSIRYAKTLENCVNLQKKSQPIYDAIRVHCGETLAILNLHKVCLPVVIGNVTDSAHRSPTFSNLKEISMDGCFETLPDGHDDRMEAFCGNGPSQRRYSSSFLKCLPSPETLQKLSIRYCNLNKTFAEDLGRCQQLRELHVNRLFCGYPADRCHLGEKLYFVSGILMQLGATDTLQRLTLKNVDIGNEEFNVALNRYPNLRELCIDNVRDSRTISFRAVNSFNALSAFSFSGIALVPNQIIRLVKKMPKLDNLYINNDDKTNPDYKIPGSPFIRRAQSYFRNKFFWKLVNICKERNRKLVFSYRSYYNHRFASKLVSENVNYVEFVDRNLTRYWE